MAWHIAENSPDCENGEPFAVVQDDTDEVVGCHDTRESAQEHIDEMIADENETDDGPELFEGASKATAAAEVTSLADDSIVPDGQIRVGDGSLMSQAEFERARRWSGVLVVEGITTGDGREFAPEALEWVEAPLIRWQKETAHGGEHDVTVTVGRADRVWRDKHEIRGEGVLDIVSPDGFEIYRRMREGFAGGISIDADDIADADVEVVWPESPNESAEDDNPLRLLFGKPEKMVFHGGRVRAATIVDIPAFVEAKIALIGDGDATLVAGAKVTSIRKNVILQHHTSTTDAPWTVKSQGMKRTAPLAAYAWGNKDIALFLHHEVADGKVGAANLTACASAIGLLQTKRGLIPEADERAVYEHLAGHLRDAGLMTPVFPALDALSAAVSMAPERKPPREWFTDPGLSVPVGITITDEGRVYGHAAQWGECHVGFDDLCVTPPVEDTHPHFMTGEVVCADGSRVAVGQITVGTGHAPLSYRATRAAEHYDNTGAAVADVVVGNDEVGIWVAGAIRPHAEQARIYDLRAAGRVSGDWRRIGGELRLVGLLGINVAGFQLRTRARVASGVPQSLVAAGQMTIGNVAPKEDVEHDNDQEALRHVMGMLARRVTGEV